MKRIAMTCMLKDGPGVIEAYDKYHASPWPEVVEGGYRAGIRRVFIYRIGRRLFMFMEVVDDFDMARDMPKYMEHPKAKKWDELMRTFQTNVPEAGQDTTWVELKEIHAIDHIAKP